MLVNINFCGKDVLPKTDLLEKTAIRKRFFSVRKRIESTK